MLPEHQIIDCNTDRNIFVWWNRDDAMDVKELKNVTADYKKVKIIQYQNGGTEKKATVFSETETMVQRAITEIKR